MLDLDTCERLKDAGVPQVVKPGDRYYLGDALFRHSGRARTLNADGCRIYNSDELLAYIGERWPGLSWNFTYDPGKTDKAGDYNRANCSTLVNTHDTRC